MAVGNKIKDLRKWLGVIPECECRELVLNQYDRLTNE